MTTKSTKPKRTKKAPSQPVKLSLTEQNMTQAMPWVMLKVNPADLQPSPFQPRTSTDDLTELMASINHVGLLHPPIVRDGQAGGKELVAGHRRNSSCVALGWTEIEVRYLPVCDEETVRIIQLAENAARTNVHPLDEASAYNELLDRLGTVEAVAESVGIQVPTIKKRLSLLSLTPQWTMYWRTNDLVTLGAAQALAVLGAGDQDSIFAEFVSAPEEVWGMARELMQAPGPKVTEALIREAMQQKREQLRHAPFDIEDAGLPGGACSACPKRASTQRELFGELHHDRCLDRSCWRSKIEATNAKLLDRVGRESPVEITGYKDRAQWVILDDEKSQKWAAKLEEKAGITAPRQALKLLDKQALVEAIHRGDFARVEAAIKLAEEASDATTPKAPKAADINQVPARTSGQRDYSWVPAALDSHWVNVAPPSMKDLLLVSLLVHGVVYGEELLERFHEVLKAEEDSIDMKCVIRLMLMTITYGPHWFESEETEAMDALLSRFGLRAPEVAAKDNDGDGSPPHPWG
ncbi:MAG: ParB/RepB/Spo0J family partition protein [Methyloceanibacter sp.]